VPWQQWPGAGLRSLEFSLIIRPLPKVEVMCAAGVYALKNASSSALPRSLQFSSMPAEFSFPTVI